MDLSGISILLIVGFFAGFINVIVGSGSSIMVPSLIFLGLSPHIAIATNRFAMLFNNLTGAIRYHQKDRLHLKIAVLFSVFAAFGAVIGSLWVLKTNPDVLRQIIAAILIIEALIVALYHNNRLGLERIAIEFTKKHYIVGCGFGFLVGLYGGFIGMAMTSILIFFLVALFGFKFIESSAIAKVITFIISLVATVIFFANFKVNIFVGTLLVMAYIAGAFAGVHSAIKMGDHRVKTLFIIVVLGSAFELIFK